MQKTPRIEFNTSFINHMNVFGVLHRPKGITLHSYRPSRVLNVVFLFVFLSNPNLVIMIFQIFFGEDLRFIQFIC